MLATRWPPPAPDISSTHLSLGLQKIISIIVHDCGRTGPRKASSYLHGIPPLREMSLSLLLLLRYDRSFLLAQPSADRASLLCPEIKGNVFLVLVEKTELCSLIGVDDCEDLGDRFAEIMAEATGVSTSSKHRLNTACSNSEWKDEVGKTYILVSFEAAPPAIFCTRRVPNSFFKSSS